MSYPASKNLLPDLVVLGTALGAPDRTISSSRKRNIQVKTFPSLFRFGENNGGDGQDLIISTTDYSMTAMGAPAVEWARTFEHRHLYYPRHLPEFFLLTRAHLVTLLALKSAELIGSAS